MVSKITKLSHLPIGNQFNANIDIGTKVKNSYKLTSSRQSNKINVGKCSMLSLPIDNNFNAIFDLPKYRFL